MKKQFWRFVLLLAILTATMQFVSAQVRPIMAVYALWTPDEQLTSISGDDRYVDLQIYAQGNIPFWAVNISCTVGNTSQLDLVGTLSFPSEWGVLADGVGGDDGYYFSPQSDALLYSNTGVLAFTATRVGTTNAQLGMNGQDYTQLIATARFKVNNLSANAQIAATCTVMDFIDRNGAVVFRARQTRMNNLMVYTGYTLTGIVRRQGTTNHTNIEVTCGLLNNFNATKQSVFTASTGAFSFGGAGNTLRHLGVYRCIFESEFVQGNPNSLILLGYMDFDMDTPVKNLLPVTLHSGDANGNATIEFNDVTSVAAANGSVVAPFTGNDMNGDGKVDRLDIVFPAGNMGLSDAPNGLLSEHILYGIGRDLDPAFTFPNSRIWLGTPTSGDLVNFNTRSRSRDFWPNLSPDGGTIAYVSQDPRTGKHVLTTLLVSTGVSAAFRFPTTFTDDAFAPSWSPDGSRIAFICATNSANSGYLYNQGDICIVNNADRAGLQINRLGVQSRIFPPTWLSYDMDAATAGEQAGYVLLYGGTDGDIHYYDLASSSHGELAFNAGAVVDADVVDMPVIVNYLYSTDNYLAYRFNDADASYDPHIRMGTISYNGTVFSGGVVGVLDADHVSLSASTTGVDYYDVSPGLDIMFYREYNYAKANYVGQDPFVMVTMLHNDSSLLTWPSAITHIPDSSVAHPTNASDFPSSSYNPASPSTPTYLHVWRMSFDYVP